MDDDAEHAAPSELTDFLRGIKLQHLAGKLAALGYDDVEDFANYNESSLQLLRDVLVREGVPVGHVDKLLRAVAARSAPGNSQQQPVPQPPGVFTAPPAAGTGGALPLAPLPPAAVAHAAALAVGAAAAAMHEDAHAVRVHQWIADAEKLNPDAPPGCRPDATRMPCTCHPDATRMPRTCHPVSM